MKLGILVLMGLLILVITGLHIPGWVEGAEYRSLYYPVMGKLAAISPILWLAGFVLWGSLARYWWKGRVSSFKVASLARSEQKRAAIDPRHGKADTRSAALSCWAASPRAHFRLLESSRVSWALTSTVLLISLLPFRIDAAYSIRTSNATPEFASKKKAHPLAGVRLLIADRDLAYCFSRKLQRLVAVVTSDWKW